jgi:16S rRNA (guanine(966)-N(2))-methyltransferase RsmD
MSGPRRGLLSEVRIIGGQWKRSKLAVLDRPGLRPTPDRVRETLFNWLGQDLSGWRCLDAFAGSGALGFEAASRGATEVVMIERDAALQRQLREVRERLKATQVRIDGADALAWMARCEPERFDLVFLDPPFDAGLFDAALAAAAQLPVRGGFVYLEANAAWPAQALHAHGLQLVRHARAGAVHAHLLRRASGDSDEGYTSAPATRAKE